MALFSYVVGQVTQVGDLPSPVGWTNGVIFHVVDDGLYAVTEESWQKITNADVSSYEVRLADVEVLLGGAFAEAITLKQWTAAGSYELSSVTRNADGLVVSGVVLWPDDSAGAYTSTDFNPSFGLYDGYTITHADSSQTVTQAAVTRNDDGFITAYPALAVA